MSCHVIYHIRQSRSQSPRSSVGGIVGLWENAEENQPFIGCLIISLTHSLLIEICAILIIQKAYYTLVYLTRLFISSLTLRLHSTEQYIHKHNTNYTIQKYMHRNITQCKLHAGMRPYVHNKYLTGLLSIWFSRLIPGQEFLKELET